MRRAAVRCQALLWGLLLALLAGCSAYRSRPFPEPAVPETREPRLLFFALDAVPYELLAELTDPALGDEALFAGYTRPVPLISSFPATSSVAFAGILEPLGLPPAPGYEAKHFNREANEVQGGTLGSYRDLPTSWRDFFTWRYANPIPRAFATATPVRSSVREVRWVLERFVESEEPVFHGYVAMTDGAAHLEGPESLAATMQVLDREIERIRREHPEMEFHAVIYSDHGISGGPKLVNVREGVEAVLQRAGYRLNGRLESGRDVVMVPFGLVSSFEAYVLPGDGPGLARTLAKAPGVDLCVARLEPGSSWLVAGGDGEGEAVVERRREGGASLWRYRSADGEAGGDPLDYLPVIERFHREIGFSETAWLPDDVWFSLTWDHLYPDALYRLARTFDLVLHPASAVCSVEPGYMYGAAITDWAARLTTGHLRWTHGALHAPSSYGFLLTDVPGWQPPPALRFDEALVDFLGDR